MGNLLIQIFRYLIAYKKIWIGPLIMILLILGSFVFLINTAALSPLIYAIF